jgi:uncharacterized small protein (DUF1192 family)
MMDQDARLKGLREELRGYVVRGLADRAAAVEAEIARLEGKAAPKAAAREKRPKVTEA